MVEGKRGRDAFSRVSMPKKRSKSYLMCDYLYDDYVYIELIGGNIESAMMDSFIHLSPG